jgi:hypothetical protein
MNSDLIVDAKSLVEDMLEKHNVKLESERPGSGSVQVLVPSRNIQPLFSDMARAVVEKCHRPIKLDDVEFCLYAAMICSGAPLPSPDDLGVCRFSRALLLCVLAMVIGAVTGSTVGDDAFGDAIKGGAAMVIGMLSGLVLGQSGRLPKLRRRLRLTRLRRGEYTRLELEEEITHFSDSE